MRDSAERRRSTPPGPPDPASIAAALLSWFADSARDMPWRRTLDPYGIWVSEIMLQQTQVKTVIPYWERWMAELPTIQSLADAPIEQVLRLWEGLGYYSRARNLRKAAAQIVASHRGKFPEIPADILELPGIGRYTAGAIASIAFNRPEPILDGNVIRVLCRIHAWPGDPKSAELNRRLWNFSAALVLAAASSPVVRGKNAAALRFSGNCSRLNQSLMELGATVCRAANPTCDACPLVKVCTAHAMGRTDRFPTTADRPPAVQRRLATVLWTKGRKWLVRQRPEGEVNAGYWEFPTEEIAPGADPAAALAQWLRVPVDSLVARGRCRHSITRYRITEEVFSLARSAGSRLPSGELRWVDRTDLASIPLTGAHRKLARKLLASER